MKIMNSRKKVIAALSLSAFALTGCNKVNTVNNGGSLYNIEDNSLVKSYDEDLSFIDYLTTKSTGLNIFISPDMYNNTLLVEYDSNKEASDEVYEYINNAINDMTEDDTLNIHLSKSNLDFSKVNVSKFKSLVFDVANVDFDYTPFYNNTYDYLSIDINEKTNIDSIVAFLENIKVENASVYIDFENNTKIKNSQRVIDALAKINSVDSINLSHSNINELNVADLVCHTLTLNNPTTSEKINYDFTINDAVEKLYIDSAFLEEHEGESYLEGFKINSNNDKLSINYQIYQCGDRDNLSIKADNQSIIDVPDNTELDISGLDISNVSNEWLKRFSNLNSVSIRLDPSNESTFAYFSDTMTIDEAVVEKCLEEIGVSYEAADGYIFIYADFGSNLGLVPDELYTLLESKFEDPSNNYLVIRNLNNQFDFSRVDLSNITMVSINSVGQNFDYSPFYNQNFESLSLQIGDDTNHERTLEFLKNIPNNNIYIDISFIGEKCQKPKLQQRYIDVLSNKDNLERVVIDTNIADRLNYENLVTENLTLFIESDKDVINYDISINDQVKDFTILTTYDSEYSKKTYIGDIKVNSNNDKLITNLHFANNSIDNYFNINLNSYFTKITVPNASGLQLCGVDFDNINYDVIESLDYLRYLYIQENDNSDYVFYYLYNDNTFDEALNKFKRENKDRQGKRLTIN